MSCRVADLEIVNGNNFGNIFLLRSPYKSINLMNKEGELPKKPLAAYIYIYTLPLGHPCIS